MTGIPACKAAVPKAPLPGEQSVIDVHEPVVLDDRLKDLRRLAFIGALIIITTT